MIIKRLILGPVATNCYIFLDEDSKEAAVIDPSADHESILNLIKENGYKLKKIFLTEILFRLEKMSLKLFIHLVIQ